MTSVPLYETLGGELLNIILTQTEMTTLFGSNVCLVNVLNNIEKGNNKYLKKVINFDRESTDQLRELAEQHGVTIVSYHEDLIEKYNENY